MSSKVFNEFSKTFFWPNDKEGCHCGWKFQLHRCFGFAIATLPLFQHPANFKNFNFSLYTVPAEMLYLQNYLTNIQKRSFGERWWRWLLWMKISSAQTFWICNGNSKTFPTSKKCKNFNFSLYTVPAEMLYLQKYLAKSQKRFFWLKSEEGGYSVWKFQVHRYFSFAIAALPLFQHPENVKISILPFTLSQQKCYVFKSV